MSAAAFVLAINLFIAATFATAFGIVAVHQRSALGARWLAFAYGLGILNVALEFVLPLQADHRPVSFSIFAVFLLALACLVVGLAHHYRVARPWRLLGAAVLACLLVNVLTLDLSRTSLLRNLLYQAPYALMQAIGLMIVLQSRRRRPLDLALMALLVLSGLQFLAKAFLASSIGSGAAPQAYMTSTYAALSQSMGAMLLVINGLLVLFIMVADIMAEITAASETDTLSGLYNRRGFEDHADRALVHTNRNGIPVAVVVADLDHFKQINDTYGHAAGDNIITLFAETMRQGATTGAVIARMGGEEFAAFLPGANLFSGKLYAEMVRSAFGILHLDRTGLPYPPTASFGVAQLMPGERLSEVLRRADAALYAAKTAGRDRVEMAVTTPAAARAGPPLRNRI